MLAGTLRMSVSRLRASTSGEGDPQFLERILDNIPVLNLNDAVKKLDGVKYHDPQTEGQQTFEYRLARLSIEDALAWAESPPEDIEKIMYHIDADRDLAVQKVAALRLWTATCVYHVITSVLRDPTRTVSSIEPALCFLRLFYSGLHSLPESYIYEGPLYRAEEGVRANWDARMRPGKSFGFFVPASFSREGGVLKDFKRENGTRTVYEVPDGIGYCLKPFSVFPDEDEVLMECVTILVVEKSEKFDKDHLFVKCGETAEGLHYVCARVVLGVEMLSNSPVRRREKARQVASGGGAASQEVGARGPLKDGRILASDFAVGEQVEYLSKSYNKWIQARVLRVNAENVDLDVKEGAELDRIRRPGMQAARLGQATTTLPPELRHSAAEQGSAIDELAIGDPVWYYSTSQQQWIPAKFLGVNADGTLRLDVKESVDISSVRVMALPEGAPPQSKDPPPWRSAGIIPGDQEWRGQPLQREQLGAPAAADPGPMVAIVADVSPTLTQAFIALLEESKKDRVLEMAEYAIYVGHPSLDKAMGSLMGMAVAAGIGHNFEFVPVRDLVVDKDPRLVYPHDENPRGLLYRPYNKFKLLPGQWTGDTSMALCMADSLLLSGGFDGAHMRIWFWNWWNNGLNNAFRLDMARLEEHRRRPIRADQGQTPSMSVGLGGDVKGSLEEVQRCAAAGQRIPPAYNAQDQDKGNGSIVRLAPVALRYDTSVVAARKVAFESSLTTHAGPLAAEACALLAHLLVRALRRSQDDRRTAMAWLDDMCTEYSMILHSKLQQQGIAGGRNVEAMRKVLRFLQAKEPDNSLERCWNWRTPADEQLGVIQTVVNRGSTYNGYPVTEEHFGAFCLDGLAMALHALYTTTDFDSAIVKAINMAGDADTTGAICGQLAGAFYGMRAINPLWVKDVRKWDDREIELRAVALFVAGLAFG